MTPASEKREEIDLEALELLLATPHNLTADGRGAVVVLRDELRALLSLARRAQSQPAPLLREKVARIRNRRDWSTEHELFDEAADTIERLERERDEALDVMSLRWPFGDDMSKNGSLADTTRALFDAFAFRTNSLRARLEAAEKQRDDHFGEIERARILLTQFTLYREKLICFIAETTDAQRDRARELATQDCDYDRTVLAALKDFDRLRALVEAPLSRAVQEAGE